MVSLLLSLSCAVLLSPLDGDILVFPKSETRLSPGKHAKGALCKAQKIQFENSVVNAETCACPR